MMVLAPLRSPQLSTSSHLEPSCCDATAATVDFAETFQGDLDCADVIAPQAGHRLPKIPLLKGSNWKNTSAAGGKRALEGLGICCS